MAVGSNVVSIVVQATDQATAPLKKVQAALQETSATAKRANEQMQTSAQSSGRAQAQAADQAGEASLSFRHKLLFMSSAMAGAAAIGSVLAQNNKELSHTLQTASLAISGAGTAIHAFANVMRGAALLVGGWTLAIAAAVVAVVVLVRNWDQAVEFAKRTWTNFSAFMVKLWGGIATTAQGIGEILAGALTFDTARIQRGLAEFRTGIQQLGAMAGDVGHQIGDKLKLAWGAVSKFFAGPEIKKAAQEAQESIRNVTDSLIDQAATVAMVRALNRGATLDQAAAIGALTRQRLGEKLSLEEVARAQEALRLARQKDTAAAIDWAKVEAQADPILRGMLATMEKFKTPWEEGAQGAEDFGKELDDLLGLAKPLAEQLEISVADAADLVRAAMKRATDQSISFKKALDDILFERRGGIDWIRVELEGVSGGLKKAWEALGKFKFGLEDMNISEAPSGATTVFSKLAQSAGQAFAQMRQAWASSIGDMAVGLQGFADGANAIWNAMRQAFSNIIAGIVLRWLESHVVMKAITAAWAAIEIAFAKLVAWAKALAAHAGIPFIGIVLGIAAAIAIIGMMNQPRGLAEGGIVTRPTHALIGEAGPEAVIPLSQMGGFMGGGGGPTVNVYNPTIVGEFGAWEFSKIIREEVRKESKRESLRPNRLTTGRPAAAWTGGGDASHTSFKSLRR